MPLLWLIFLRNVKVRLEILSKFKTKTLILKNLKALSNFSEILGLKENKTGKTCIVDFIFTELI